ncbi:MAG TPA: alpha/beta hydrolase [Acidimicrobiia bacterium]
MSDDVAGDGEPGDQPRSPLQLLDALAADEVRVTPTLRHVEVYTMHGLLTLLWHGDEHASQVLLCCGGAMGGLLGPANALFHDLGERLWAERGIGTIRVGYRKPNHLPRCVHDVAAAADLATRSGAQRFVTMGHSFGGAVALQAGMVLEQHCAGVVTLSTQSAGCEMAASLRAPLLLFHGDRDEILPLETSYVVQSLAGHGEVVVLDGNGHLLDKAADELRDRLFTWIPERLDAPGEV